jgi:hypothetical protein
MSRPLLPSFDEPPPSLPDWFERAVRQLLAIKRLPDGWDSHGARRPDDRTVHRARAMLESLAAADNRLAMPAIDPTPSGGVQFVWEFGPRYFEVELVDPFKARYYYVDVDLKTEEEGALREGKLAPAASKALRDLFKPV